MSSSPPPDGYHGHERAAVLDREAAAGNVSEPIEVAPIGPATGGRSRSWFARASR